MNSNSSSYNFSASVCSWEGVHCDNKKENVIGLKASGLGLSGFIPDTTIGKLTQLQSLDLSNNKITALPSDLWSLGSLKSLNLSSNQISGSLPNNIGNFGLLEVIDLSGNNFSGDIPTAISSLVNLHVLKLNGNGFQGSIPTGLLSCKSLVLLDLSSNQLTGSLPDGFAAAFPEMKMLNLARNEISGRDTDFSGMESLTSLNISRNLFKGSVTGVFQGQLQVIDLSKNQFQGHFSQATSVPVVIFEKPLLNITFADLLAATSNFDRGTLLAEGKFGPVYRGFLPGGIHVAVKVLVHGSTLTEQEAARELEHLGRIKHPNLVPLTGYCLAGDQRIAIYDYMENGNLQHLLYDLPLGVQATEDWSTDTWEEDNNGIQNVGSEGLLTTWAFRHKIALGTARALAFLHHGCSPPIIHRDVKASSVYLDYNLEPRLSDFGLAKVFGTGLEDEIARGSPGYVPPEFCQPECDAPTPKSDVYCFGVVLFELITGKKPIGDDYPDEQGANLVSWVRGLVRKNQGSKAIDPKIRDTGPDYQMEEALKIGYLCTADLPTKRPSMQQIVGLLKDIEPRAPQ
ncbi:hypothetical protein COLO4_18800 [Corchorus olitorius]|uniref:Protein kinase domain-containing protein n=1 Tax=Corchorus olitorius TaxID=93759 RepID=A0A1R3J7V5_9ROSI|nr:hypothetical protein COLO4_18800 [Corchorus olitorius]